MDRPSLPPVYAFPVVPSSPQDRESDFFVKRQSDVKGFSRKVHDREVRKHFVPWLACGAVAVFFVLVGEAQGRTDVSALLLFVAVTIGAVLQWRVRARFGAVGVDGIALPGRFIPHSSVQRLEPLLDEGDATLVLTSGETVGLQFEVPLERSMFVRAFEERLAAYETHATPSTTTAAEGYRRVRVQTAQSELGRVLEGDDVDEAILDWAKPALARER
ncbi:MAG: hypothetical protein AAF645_19120 [Myxococcota bacterium]